MSEHKQSFISKYIFSTDHKMIGIQFLWYGLFFLFIGGFQAMLIRWQMASPGVPVPMFGNLLFPESGGIITPDAYSQIFTMHGTIMIFWAVTPLINGTFANFVIPLQIGAKDMAFPKLNMFSFWIFFLSGIVLLLSYVTPGGPAAAGWTSYPPLSTPVGGIPGMGQALWSLALTLAGVSTMMGAINYITTIVRCRAKGMNYFKMPLTCWGLFLSAILNALFVPIIAAGLILLLVENTLGTQFFIAGGKATIAGGDPLLFQHVFWIFGHPEVYILVLPIWGMVSDILPVFSRKPAFGYKTTVICMSTVVALSSFVWGHHMYTTGMSPLLGKAFMFLTLLISIPSAIFFLNWLATIWKGSIRMHVPMLFMMSVIFVFGLGGLTGLYLATITADMYFHDSMFVVGHFHYTLAATLFMGIFGGLYYWFPKMFGKKLNEGLGKLHFWGTFLFLNFAYFNMMVTGYAGQHRRLFDPSVYDFIKPLMPLNKHITTAAFLLGAAQLIFLINVIFTLLKKEKAEKNPWDSATLEWTVENPIPHGNFAIEPVVYNDPYEYSNPALKDRDWVPQTEKI
ncbi:Alternative cytochrome c oxidase polypeptide CoxN [hydrothermal vent metagenome]|uniref:Alternative cytochrome c oxidase polypeptide CoxN n=1 Tax=hydrothermal vent metagenome TaxID=652676 RepID=A0A3B1E0F1_9ZZZZ